MNHIRNVYFMIHDNFNCSFLLDKENVTGNVIENRYIEESDKTHQHLNGPKDLESVQEAPKVLLPDAVFVVGFRVKSCLKLWQSYVTLELPIVIRHQGYPPQPLSPGPGELSDDSGH